MDELKKQVDDLIKHKNAVNKVIKELQEKISKLDARITKIEQKSRQVGPGFVVPVR